MNIDPDSKFVFMPNSALFGALVAAQSWLFELICLLGKQDPLRQVISASVCIAASAFYLTVGRKALRKMHPLPAGYTSAITYWQAAGAALFVVGGGLYYYWMFND